MRVYVIPAQAPCKAYDTKADDVEGLVFELQALVDGYVELCTPVQLKQHGIELLCNEEGLLRGLPCNINMFPFFFVGTLVAVGVGDEDFVSLTPEQEQWLKQWIENLS